MGLCFKLFFLPLFHFHMSERCECQVTMIAIYAPERLYSNQFQCPFPRPSRAGANDVRTCTPGTSHKVIVYRGAGVPVKYSRTGISSLDVTSCCYRFNYFALQAAPGKKKETPSPGLPSKGSGLVIADSGIAYLYGRACRRHVIVIEGHAIGTLVISPFGSRYIGSVDLDHNGARIGLA